MGIVNQAAGAEAEALVNAGAVVQRSAMQVAAVLADARAKETANRVQDALNAADNAAADIVQQYKNLHGYEAEGGPEGIAKALDTIHATQMERIAKYGKEAVDKFDVYYQDIRGRALRGAAEHWAGEDQALRVAGSQQDTLLARRKAMDAARQGDIPAIVEAVGMVSANYATRFPGENKAFEIEKDQAAIWADSLEELTNQNPGMALDVLPQFKKGGAYEGVVDAEKVVRLESLAGNLVKKERSGKLYAVVAREYGNNLDGALNHVYSPEFVSEHGIEVANAVAGIFQARERENQERDKIVKDQAHEAAIIDASTLLEARDYAGLLALAKDTRSGLTPAERRSIAASAVSSRDRNTRAAAIMEEKGLREGRREARETASRSRREAKSSSDELFEKALYKLVTGEWQGPDGLREIGSLADGLEASRYKSLIDKWQGIEKEREKDPGAPNMQNKAIDDYASASGLTESEFALILDTERRREGWTVHDPRIVLKAKQMTEVAVDRQWPWGNITFAEQLLEQIEGGKVPLDAGAPEDAPRPEPAQVGDPDIPDATPDEAATVIQALRRAGRAASPANKQAALRELRGQK